MGGDDEGIAGGVGGPLGLAGEFYVHSAADDLHGFLGRGTEFIFSGGHDAEGGRAVGAGEGDGFYFTVEVFIGLKHFYFLISFFLFIPTDINNWLCCRSE